MKTKLILVLLALASICMAQPALKYITFNAPDVRQFADSVAMNVADEYEFRNQGVSADNRTLYVVNYNNVADSLVKIVVTFRIHLVGGTDDQVNPGSPQYIFEKIAGRFNDIYPFWSKFMHPKAVQSVVLDKKKDEAIVRGATYDFAEEGAGWSIVKF